MFKNIQIARFFGVPIKLHWSFFLLLFLVLLHIMADLSGGLNFLIVVVLLFISVIAHELAHTLVARKFKIFTYDILLTPIGGMARIADIPTEPRAEIIIALAGPALSILLGLLTLPFLILSLNAMRTLAEAGIVFQSIVGIGALFSAINLMLGIFNLVPAFPMDGGRVLRAILARKLGLLKATRVAAFVGRVIAVVFFITGLLLSHWGLIIIAVFVYIVAGMEQRNVEYREMMRQLGLQGAPFPPAFLGMLRALGVKFTPEKIDESLRNSDVYEYRGQQIYFPDREDD